MSDAILSELEWDDGLAIPIANAENKQLEEELVKLHQENEDAKHEVNDHNSHISKMLQHFKNVEQENTHTICLQRAVSKDMDTEAHMTAIAEREEGRIKQEMLRYDKEMVVLRERRNRMENRVFLDNQQMEELKSQLNWDHQALEAWLEESARRDDDAMTLQKYSLEDDSKLKSLTLHIEHLMKESQQKRKCLDKEALETLIAQIELDRTAEDFRQTHQERQELIALWESTIDLMIKRDREMDEAADILLNIKTEMSELERIIQEKEAFLQSEIENNAEMDRNIKAEERTVARLKNDLDNHESVQNQIQNDFDTLCYTVARTSSEVDALRAAVSVLKNQFDRLRDKYHNHRRDKKELLTKLELTQQNAMTAEEKLNLAEKVLVEEEQLVRDFTRVVARTRDFHFKKKQELMQEIGKEKNVAAEIQGGRASSRNLSSRLKKLGRHAIKQQEIIYNQDFRIQQLARRLARLDGEMNTFEKNQLEAKIADLLQILEDKQFSKNTLNAQLKRLQDDIRRQKRDLETSTAMVNKEQVQLQSLELTIDTSLIALKKTTKKREDTMVEESILKIKIQRFQEDLHKKAGKVLNLEKRREKLATALKERKKEILIHHDILRSQLKYANEEKSLVNAELHQRTEKISRLQSRYEILTISMIPPEGSEQQSQAYYVIKAAQEKEALQRKGDNLDARIIKAEKEIRALDNTLNLLNSRNNKMRQTLRKVTETSEEYEIQSQLNEQLHAILDKYKYKRRQIRELQDDMQILSSSLDAILRDESKLIEMMDEKRNKAEQISHELEEQKEKLDRAYKQVFRVAREARQARGTREELFEERDIELRNMKSQNKGLIQALIEAVRQYPDVVITMERYFGELNLPLPPLTSRSSSSSESMSSLSSSRCSSKRSSSKSSSVAKTVDLGLDLPLSPASQIPRPRSDSELSTTSASPRTTRTSWRQSR